MKYVFFELTLALKKISTGLAFDGKVRNDASALVNKLMTFETVAIVMFFLQIFKITTPLSDYLQRQNLDYTQAWRLIQSSASRLNDLWREHVFEATAKVDFHDEIC